MTVNRVVRSALQTAYPDGVPDALNVEHERWRRFCYMNRKGPLPSRQQFEQWQWAK